jgi:hypothetical protein
MITILNLPDKQARDEKKRNATHGMLSYYVFISSSSHTCWTNDLLVNAYYH